MPDLLEIKNLRIEATSAHTVSFGWKLVVLAGGFLASFLMVLVTRDRRPA